MPLAPAFDEPAAPPVHVAIIMDGNGRWATGRGLPRFAGHQRGAEAVREAVEGCNRLGVRYLTLYAFSSENWKRPQSEVNDLMGLLRVYVKHELADLHSNNVRVRFIGDHEALPPDIQDLINGAEERTRENSGLNLVIALNYGARNEIVGAARFLANEVKQGRLDADAITEQVFASHLTTADIPDPDLIIRTSGEQRLSNFLLWQSAYCELSFVDTLWPDFTQEHLAKAIEDYHKRERRYGATSA
jgi:undecaprenyl diphosphate synthase